MKQVADKQDEMSAERTVAVRERIHRAETKKKGSVYKEKGLPLHFAAWLTDTNGAH